MVVVGDQDLVTGWPVARLCQMAAVRASRRWATRAVSICAVTDTASCPPSWRLFLPERWDDTCAAEEEVVS